MPGITLDLADAAEHAETLALLNPMAIRQRQANPRRQLHRLHRPPRLQHRHPPRRPAPVRVPPRRQRRRRTLRRADPMITNCTLTHPPPDKITPITPIIRVWPGSGTDVVPGTDQPDLAPDQDQFWPVKGLHSLGCHDIRRATVPAAWSASVDRWRLSQPRRAANSAGLGDACGCRHDGVRTSHGQGVMSSSAATGMTRLGIL